MNLRRGAALAIATLAVMLPLLPVPEFWFLQLNHIGLAALVVLGLVALTGIAGLTSFGQAAFVGIGAYATAYLTSHYGWSPWLTLLAGLCLTGLSALLLGAITLNMSGHYLPLATIAWSIALYYLFGSLPWLGQYDGMAGLPPIDLLGWTLNNSRSMYGLIWLCVALAAWGLLNLLDSRPGRAMRALKYSIQMAESVGVHTTRLKTTIFVMAALLASVSGWLFAHLQRAINPTPFGLNASMESVIMLVAGGMTAVWGAVLGSALVKLVQDQLQVWMPALIGQAGNFEGLVFGLVLIGLLRFAPEGAWVKLAQLGQGRHAATPQPRSPAVTVSGRSTRAEKPGDATPSILQVQQFNAHYRNITALHDIDLNVPQGAIVTVIGPNGAGKSTLLNALMGLVRSSGNVYFDGRSLARCGVEQRAMLGISLVPEQRALFADMTVLDNLQLGSFRRRRLGQTQFMDQLEWVWTLFPRLKERARQQAGTLSGGERQMLALGRALMGKPRLLMLDEPSLGLAPRITREVLGVVAGLREHGVSTLLVEQNARAALALADYAYVLENGRLVLQGTGHALGQHPRIMQSYLGMARSQPAA